MHGKFKVRNPFQWQSFTKYLRQTLVFMWNSAVPKICNFCFSWEFYYYWHNFRFRRRTECYTIVLWSSEIFLICISLFHNILSLKSIRNSWGNSYVLAYYALLCFVLLLVKFIWPIIRKSQIFMNMIAKFYFAFYFFISSFKY